MNAPQKNHSKSFKNHVFVEFLSFSSVILWVKHKYILITVSNFLGFFLVIISWKGVSLFNGGFGGGDCFSAGQPWGGGGALQHPHAPPHYGNPWSVRTPWLIYIDSFAYLIEKQSILRKRYSKNKQTNKKNKKWKVLVALYCNFS